MNAWLKAFNPFAVIDTEAEALRAARASALPLWLSGAKWVLGAVLMIDDMPAMRGAMAASNSALDTAMQDVAGAEIVVTVVGCVGLFQILLGVVQWRKPNATIPTAFLVLSVFGLGSGLWKTFTGGGETGAAWAIALSYFTLVVAVVFHWAGMRGADRLKAFRRA